MYKKVGWGIATVTLLVAFCVYAIYKIPLQLGIDLRGGTELIYELDLSRIEKDRAGVAGQVKDIIARRLNAYGLKEISLSVQGEDRLVIQLPGSDPESVRGIQRQIETAGNLTFRLLAPPEDQIPEKFQQYEDEERDYVDKDRAWVRRKIEEPTYTADRPKPPDYLVRHRVERRKVGDKEQLARIEGERGRVLLQNFHSQFNPDTGEWEPQGIISGRYLSRANETLDPNTYRPAVAFEFKGEGATAFGELTGPNVGRDLAIVLDDDVMQVAKIKDRITERGQLTGDYTSDEVRGIVTILRGGSLPTKPRPISESTVGAILGQDSIESGIRAVILGTIGVMLIMAIYYMVGGMVANVALAVNVLLIFSFMVLFRQTLTLPGLAGILLTLGMAVDANILIFERYREERKRGKPLAASLAAGYDRAFWVIFDSNLTTIITAYVLFYLGTPEIKGFAVTLISGLFASFFTSVYLTRLILSCLCNWGIVRELKLLEAFPPPRIPFLKHQRAFILGSIIIIGSMWALVLLRGRENYGIDFTGGARVTMNLPREMRVDVLREKIVALAKEEDELFKDYSIQTVRASSPGVSSRYALLTRAGAVGSAAVKTASPLEESPPAGQPAPAAGEKPADTAAPAEPPKAETPPPGPTPEAPKAPEPAPAASAEAPSAPPTGAPGSGAPATSPPAAPQSGPEAEKPLPTGTAAEIQAEPAQRVRKAIEGMLSREGLLLPDPFPLSDWVRDTAPAAPAGSVFLEMKVNLRKVTTEYTTQRILEELNASLSKDPLLTRTGKEQNPVYKGISASTVDLVSKPTEETPVTQYVVKTTSYVPPLPSAGRADATIPTKEQVEAAVRNFFREGVNPDLLELSEPFPQVLTVGPRVASNLQADALVAVFISLLGIVFYLSLRFEFIYGVGGVVALVHDSMFVIGMMAVADELLPDFSVKFNLNELAAVLSIIGYSINDTIVLFDRIRENFVVLAKRKYTVEDIFDLSMNQTLLRTLWTSLTVLLVTVMLLGFGGESIRGFAFLFAAGLITGSYSTIFIASPVALWLRHRGERRRALADAVG